MKKLIFTTLFCLSIASLFAQVQGNFKQRSANSSNESNISRSNYAQAQQVQLQMPQLSRGASIQGDNVLEFKINALANQKADSYTAIFNVVQLGKTAEETNTALTNRLDPFIADMKNVGIKAEDIYVDMVNFLPKFEYDVSKKLFSKKTFTEIPTGFELQKNVHVRFVQAATLDKIIEAAARHEIYDIVKVDYFVKDQKSVYNQLRTAALSYFQEISKTYKPVLNLDSAYIVTAENAWVAYPGDRYQSYQAFASQSLDPSQRADAKVERIDKPVSQFYNAIAANDYDIVLNPEILEPCVQFSYNLLLRCTIKERIPPTKTQVLKEFIMVTPTGEVKTLKIDK